MKPSRQRLFRIIAESGPFSVCSSNVLRLHDLRHAFGSWLIERGAAPSVVRDLMGHSSLAVTSRYVQSAPEGAIRAVRLLSARGWRGAGRRTKQKRNGSKISAK